MTRSISSQCFKDPLPTMPCSLKEMLLHAKTWYALLTCTPSRRTHEKGTYATAEETPPPRRVGSAVKNEDMHLSTTAGAEDVLLLSTTSDAGGVLLPGVQPPKRHRGQERGDVPIHCRQRAENISYYPLCPTESNPIMQELRVTCPLALEARRWAGRMVER